MGNCGAPETYVYHFEDSGTAEARRLPSVSVDHTEVWLPVGGTMASAFGEQPASTTYSLDVYDDCEDSIGGTLETFEVCVLTLPSPSPPPSPPPLPPPPSAPQICAEWSGDVPIPATMDDGVALPTTLPDGTPVRLEVTLEHDCADEVEVVLKTKDPADHLSIVVAARDDEIDCFGGQTDAATVVFMDGWPPLSERAGGESAGNPSIAWQPEGDTLASLGNQPAGQTYTLKVTDNKVLG